MKTRAAILAAAVLAASGVTAASAAPRRSAPAACNLLKDAKGDAFPVQDPGLDVVSADIASDGKQITGVIRLSGAPGTTSALSPTGRTYHVEFFGQGAQYSVFMSYFVAPNASAAQYGHFDSVARVNKAIGAAKVKVAENNVFITAPLSVFAPYGKFSPGSKITDLSVLTGRYVGVYVSPEAFIYNSPNADVAEDGKTYVAGTKSCIKVGG